MKENKAKVTDERKKIEPVEMSDAARAAKREAHRKWQQEHKDRVKAYQARYWNKQAMLAESAESK